MFYSYASSLFFPLSLDFRLYYPSFLFFSLNSKHRSKGEGGGGLFRFAALNEILAKRVKPIRSGERAVHEASRCDRR